MTWAHGLPRTLGFFPDVNGVGGLAALADTTNSLSVPNLVTMGSYEGLTPRARSATAVASGSRLFGNFLRIGGLSSQIILRFERDIWTYETRTGRTFPVE